MVQQHEDAGRELWTWWRLVVVAVACGLGTAALQVWLLGQDSGTATAAAGWTVPMVLPAAAALAAGWVDSAVSRRALLWLAVAGYAVLGVSSLLSVAVGYLAAGGMLAVAAVTCSDSRRNGSLLTADPGHRH
ncbi:hypothetical protein SGUI_2132 [Serinicoccus hydrothermalis]|uniref:Uncharacterized protein n=1 Tax=Serinicoccus hydrothermalis TaxID=1758689 RepID=A0A1B1NDK4_9MICO|nr:hypothetical protein [Serinicoccus hydrothermalis]ANS79528.1 hypothetical protein SGUI_2132 [Serinicoccus hydrothermalis]